MKQTLEKAPPLAPPLGAVTPAEKLHALRQLIRAQGSVLVAFSGGVDSTFVLKVAVEELGERAVALTAISPSVALEEQAEAQKLAEQMGARWLTVNSAELSNPQYAQNPQNRCYFCKSELYQLCEAKRLELGLSAILDGFNSDDLKDHRPGKKAAEERKVQSPLAQVGMTKAEIRSFSKALGLPTWDKPQMPCLASRIPYGTSVTEERLLRIGRAESAVRALGLRSFRVRFHGEVARLEVAAEEYDRALTLEFRQAASAALKAEGFSYVALDLEPFRSGRLNEATVPLG